MAIRANETESTAFFQVATLINRMTAKRVNIPSSALVYLQKNKCKRKTCVSEKALFSLIPGAAIYEPRPQNKQHARKERTLKQPDQESKRVELPIIRHAGLRHCEHAPADLHRGQPVTGSDFLDDEG
jgi:hypothetical protein